MDIGVFIGPTDESMSIVEFAPVVEELGFESLWVPQHSHIPVARKTPWGGGADLPRGHMAGLDPFVALGAAAAVTSRLRLGTGACVVPEHDPIHLAKQVATVDFLSDGRFLFGVAAGWNLEEISNHGIDPGERWDVMEDRLAAMREIWTNDESEYHGRHVSFDPIWQWPKPVQRPHPPILVGGAGPNAIRHAATYGDGWLPYVGFGVLDLAAKQDEINSRAAELGRGPVPVTIFGVPVEQGAADPYVGMRVSRLIFRLPPAPAEVVLPLLETAAQLAAELREA